MGIARGAEIHAKLNRGLRAALGHLARFSRLFRGRNGQLSDRLRCRRGAEMSYCKDYALFKVKVQGCSCEGCSGARSPYGPNKCMCKDCREERGDGLHDTKPGSKV